MQARTLGLSLFLTGLLLSCGDSKNSPYGGTSPDAGLASLLDGSTSSGPDDASISTSWADAAIDTFSTPSADVASADDTGVEPAPSGDDDEAAAPPAADSMAGGGEMDAPRFEASAPSGPAVAFPGAVGVARAATGGRGTTVVHVTTLSDSGPGSFRQAVGTRGRYVVFDVGGYIVLSSPVTVSSDITIAGQTAPGDGVGVMGREVSFSGASNDIVRYFRFRQGSLDPDTSKSGINLLNTTKMIFDHVSIEFAAWNNIDSVGASNITVQNSIDANPIGQQFAAHTETGPYTWYRNLFANAHNRCPLAKANTEYIGNVVYNFQLGYTAGNSAGVFSHDVVDNYFITGPSTTTPGDAFFQVNNQVMFATGNMEDSNADGTLNGSPIAAPAAATTAKSAWSSLTASIATAGAAQAYATVLATAGASLHRDQVDALVVADVKSLGSLGHLWTSQSQTGLGNSGYGTLTGAAAPVDTDQDGMPDAWETRYGLNPKSAADAWGDFDKTGYANIEKYANGLADGSYP